MDEITPQVFMSITNSEVNTVDSTTCGEERIAIKQECQDIDDEHFEIESTISTGSVISDTKVDNDNMYSSYKESFNLKDSFIRLEKCDKIWETLKVIKNLQLSNPNKENTENYAAAFQDAMHIHSKPSTPEPIQYHPVLNNGNTALPNFQFAIKSWKRLYTCSHCGKQYTENRNLKLHLSKVHGIDPIPKDTSRSKDVPKVALTNESPRSQEISRTKEVSQPKEIARPREVARPKEMPRLKEMPHLKEMPRLKEMPPSKEVTRPNEVARSKDETLSPHKDSLKPQVCQTCGIRYVDSRSVAAHSLRVHGILTEYHERWLAQQENPNDYTVEDLLKRHCCDTCGKRYSCMKSLRMHYLREHNVVIPLMRGGRKANSRISLPTKTITHSGDLQKHMNVCNICGKKYTKNWYLRVHSLEVHGIPMPYGRINPNYTPKLRVIKKEIIEEPEVPEVYPQAQEQKFSPVKFTTPNKKYELAESGSFTSSNMPTRVLKMYQCSACKKEFISISKLRTHAFSRHGIVIPRVRKPYKKSKPSVMKAGMNVKVKLEETTQPQVSTPKQVSLDRYFKTPPSGGNVSSKGSQILSPSQSAPRKDKVKQMARSREVVPSTENIPAPAPALVKANARSKVKVPKVPADYVKCNLCARACKDIRKHYIAYHKIRYPESVMDTPFFTGEGTESTATPAAVPNKEVVASPQKSQDNTSTNRPQKKRRRKFFSLSVRKRRRTEEPKQQFQNPVIEAPVVQVPKVQSPVIQSPVVQTPKMKNFEVQSLSTQKVLGPVKTSFKCNICSGYYANARSLKLHRQKHKLKGETKENIHLFKHNYRNVWKIAQPQRKIDMSTLDESAVNIDMDIDVENDSQTPCNESVTQSSSESRVSRRRLTRSSAATYTLNETTCECGRSFRDPHTLFVHKEKCRTAHRIEKEKSMVTRSSSDRDSGIGISITIKKKNDSYEIVSRDSGDDDKSKDSTRSSDNSSNSDFDGRKYPTLVPAQCSKDHSILKIQEKGKEKGKNGSLWWSISSSILRQWQVKLKEQLLQSLDHKVAESDEDVDIEDDSQMNGDPVEEHKSVENESRTPDPLDVDLYRCATCLELFEKKEDLTKHMITHEKRPTRQECPCGKTFRGAQSFLTHVQEYHPLWLQCGYCKVSFLNSKEYYAHSCDVNEGKDFEDLQDVTCHCCLVKVKMVNFDAHVNREHLVPHAPYLCYYCKMRFFNGIQRRAHLTKDHVRPSCKICGKSLRFDYAAKHEAYHDGLGYPCHICKKAFTTTRLANSHKFEVHLREDEECKICHKVISHRHMRYHVRMHTNKDNCRICKKSFTTNRVLKDHIHQVHTNEYPFVKCENCEMSFTSERYLKRHLSQSLCEKVEKELKKVTEKVEDSEETEDGETEDGETEDGETEDVNVTEEEKETQEVRETKTALNTKTLEKKEVLKKETLKEEISEEKEISIKKITEQDKISEKDETEDINVSEDGTESEEVNVTEDVTETEEENATGKAKEITEKEQISEMEEISETEQILEMEVSLENEEILGKERTSKKKETSEAKENLQPKEESLETNKISQAKETLVAQENSDLKFLVKAKETFKAKQVTETKDIPN